MTKKQVIGLCIMFIIALAIVSYSAVALSIDTIDDNYISVAEKYLSLGKKYEERGDYKKAWEEYGFATSIAADKITNTEKKKLLSDRILNIFKRGTNDYDIYSKQATPKCADGTPVGQCSGTKDSSFCNKDRAVVPSCYGLDDAPGGGDDCCKATESKNPGKVVVCVDGKKCQVGVCSDGTSLTTCVSARTGKDIDNPKYCNDKGEIVDYSGECGCPSGMKKDDKGVGCVQKTTADKVAGAGQGIAIYGIPIAIIAYLAYAAYRRKKGLSTGGKILGAGALATGAGGILFGVATGGWGLLALLIPVATWLGFNHLVARRDENLWGPLAENEPTRRAYNNALRVFRQLEADVAAIQQSRREISADERDLLLEQIRDIKELLKMDLGDQSLEALVNDLRGKVDTLKRTIDSLAVTTGVDQPGTETAGPNPTLNDLNTRLDRILDNIDQRRGGGPAP